MIMFITSFRNFLHDETGASTIWALVWFSIYVAMGGLAVDVTDAYRNKTILQSTADSSALAAVMSLPDQADAVNQAVAYSASNMAYGVNGAVLDEDEVFIGTWDFVDNTFVGGGASPNAVRVITRRDDSNNNPLATNCLRILGLWGIPFDRFNIAVDAVAATFISDCVDRNGLIAGNMVNVQSGNTFARICIHADNNEDDPGHDYAIDIQNQNDFDPTNVEVSMPYESDLTGRKNLCRKNEGLCEEGVITYDPAPWVADELKDLPDIIDELISGGTGTIGEINQDFVPDYITESAIVDIDIGNGDEYTGVFEVGTFYRLHCNDQSSPVKLPTDVVIDRVVIATNCSINASNGVSIRDTVIASSAVGSANGNQSPYYPFTAIHLASNGILGTGDFCDSDENNPGAGQVTILALGSVQMAAQTTITGVAIRTLGDFQVSADMNAQSISVIANHDITGGIANGSFAYCGGVFDHLIKNYKYALVY